MYIWLILENLQDFFQSLDSKKLIFYSLLFFWQLGFFFLLFSCGIVQVIIWFSLQHRDHDSEDKHKPIRMQNHKCWEHQNHKQHWWSQSSPKNIISPPSSQNLFLHIMDHEIRNSWADNAFRECIESKEDPSKNKADKVDVFKYWRMILEISNQSA